MVAVRVTIEWLEKQGATRAKPVRVWLVETNLDDWLEDRAVYDVPKALVPPLAELPACVFLNDTSYEYTKYLEVHRDRRDGTPYKRLSFDTLYSDTPEGDEGGESMSLWTTKAEAESEFRRSATRFLRENPRFALLYAQMYRSGVFVL